MRADEINDRVRRLLTGLSLKADYYAASGEVLRVLLVEGITDKRFLQDRLASDVLCEIANKAFNDGTGTENIGNLKEAIRQVVFGLTNPVFFAKGLGDTSRFDVYGLVDRDTEGRNADTVNPTPRILVTDTHDLETMLMSTDPALLLRVAGDQLTKEMIRTAFFIAYQLATLRQFLYEMTDSDFNVDPARGGKKDEIRFGEFLNDSRIDFEKLARYIKACQTEKYPEGRFKALLKSCEKNKRLKKLLDKDGCWAQDEASFSPEKTPDFWDTVNGHDILAILRFLNPALDESVSRGEYRLDRNFEFLLIDNYEADAFFKTQLYRKMKGFALV